MCTPTKDASRNGMQIGPGGQSALMCICVCVWVGILYGSLGHRVGGQGWSQMSGGPQTTVGD